jgi:hypothetical protein
MKTIYSFIVVCALSGAVSGELRAETQAKAQSTLQHIPTSETSVRHFVSDDKSKTAFERLCEDIGKQSEQIRSASFQFSRFPAGQYEVEGNVIGTTILAGGVSTVAMTRRAFFEMLDYTSKPYDSNIFSTTTKIGLGAGLVLLVGVPIFAIAQQEWLKKNRDDVQLVFMNGKGEPMKQLIIKRMRHDEVDDLVKYLEGNLGQSVAEVDIRPLVFGR